MELGDATERARGLMFGIAAGNLLGVVQESCSKRELPRRIRTASTRSPPPLVTRTMSYVH